MEEASLLKVERMVSIFTLSLSQYAGFLDSTRTSCGLNSLRIYAPQYRMEFSSSATPKRSPFSSKNGPYTGMKHT